MFKDVDVILEVVAGVGTKACAHEVVAAATIIEDFIFTVYIDMPEVKDGCCELR